MSVDLVTCFTTTKRKYHRAQASPFNRWTLCGRQIWECLPDDVNPAISKVCQVCQRCERVILEREEASK